MAPNGLYLALFLLFLTFLPCHSECPLPNRIKPCRCEKIHPNSHVIRVICFNVRSWASLKNALRPFRNRIEKMPKIVEMTVENLPNRVRDTHALNRIFQWLSIGELVIRNAALDSVAGRTMPNFMFKNTTIFALTIDNCNLRTIAGHIFATIDHLQELLLPNNPISTVTGRRYWLRTDLRKIDLSGTNLRTIPKHLLSNSPNLEVLRLRGNRISSVEFDDFLNLGRLVVLDLSSNFIRKIHPLAFDILRQLDFLSLAFNSELTDENAGQSLEMLTNRECQLKTVDLSGTQLDMSNIRSQLSTMIFQQRHEENRQNLCSRLVPWSQSLTQLDLSGNVDLKNGHFRRCSTIFPKIVNLDISRTALTMIILRFFPEIRSFYVYRMRRIKRLGPYQFRKNRRIERIELIYGEIRHIDRATFVGVEDSLISLSLAYNRLSRLSSQTFGRLRKIEKLDLSYNRFLDNPEKKEFPLNRQLLLGSKNSLKELYLTGNLLVIVPHRLIANMTNLNTLNLAGNVIKRIYHYDFDTNTELTELDLRGNEIEYVDPVAFVSLTKLKLLDLGANRLTGMSNSLRIPSVLEYLSLNSNRLVSLRHANLSNLTFLRSLDLSSNKIRSFDRSTLAGSTKSLLYINLDDNELDCSCSLLPFIEWLSTSKISLSAKSRCRFPHALRGRTLIDQVCWSRCADQRRPSVDFCL